MSVTQFTSNEYVTRNNVNSRVTQINNDITSINNKFPVSVSNGGTGKTSLTSGEILLGNGTDGITSTATLPVSKGGTGGTTAEAARTNLEVMKGTSLWGNSSGYNGTMILSDDYSNYDFIYVQARNAGIGTANVFRPTTTSKVSIFNLYADDDSSVTGMYYRGAILEFSGTTVTWSRNGSYWIKKSSSADDSWTPSGSNEAGIWVTKIIGFKY